MKKLVAILMTVAMVAAMTGCKSKNETTTKAPAATTVEVKDDSAKIEQLMSIERMEAPNMIGNVGGWDGNIENLDLAKNKEAKEALEKATATLTGMNFEGIYLLGKQIVSGANYCILCRGTATTPDAAPGFYLVYVYADLQGNAEILKIDPLLEVPEGNLCGGWGANTGAVSLDENKEVKEAYEKAMKSVVLTGGEWEPVAYLGMQVVAGYNYLVLCRVKAVVDDPTTELALINIYVDPEGNATFTTENVGESEEATEESGVDASETSKADS